MMTNLVMTTLAMTTLAMTTLAMTTLHGMEMTIVAEEDAGGQKVGYHQEAEGHQESGRSKQGNILEILEKMWLQAS